MLPPTAEMVARVAPMLPERLTPANMAARGAVCSCYASKTDRSFRFATLARSREWGLVQIDRFGDLVCACRVIATYTTLLNGTADKAVTVHTAGLSHF